MEESITAHRIALDAPAPPAEPGQAQAQAQDELRRSATVEVGSPRLRPPTPTAATAKPASSPTAAGQARRRVFYLQFRAFFETAQALLTDLRDATNANVDTAFHAYERYVRTRLEATTPTLATQGLISAAEFAKASGAMGTGIADVAASCLGRLEAIDRQLRKALGTAAEPVGRSHEFGNRSVNGGSKTQASRLRGAGGEGTAADRAPHVARDTVMSTGAGASKDAKGKKGAGPEGAPTAKPITSASTAKVSFSFFFFN